VAPSEEFSAALYVSHAVPVIHDVIARQKLPILVGGTGLYLRALLQGLFEGPGRSPEVRDRLAAIAERRGTEALHRILKRWDPALAGRVHPNDRVRLIRGIEVYLGSGKRMSELMKSRASPLEGIRDILIGLRPGRVEIAARIEARGSAMFSRGLRDEVLRLKDRYGVEIPAFKAIGYRETALLLEGKIDDARARELVTRATSRYAKRQMTWFRREPGVRWFDGCGDDESLRSQVRDTLRRMIPESGDRHNPEHFHAETAS
jgi:tRNA dimethylallyltransferase